MPRTLSESRKLRLRRAFTEATNETLQCSKMVFKNKHILTIKKTKKKKQKRNNQNFKWQKLIPFDPYTMIRLAFCA